MWTIDCWIIQIVHFIVTFVSKLLIVTLRTEKKKIRNSPETEGRSTVSEREKDHEKRRDTQESETRRASYVTKIDRTRVEHTGGKTEAQKFGDKITVAVYTAKPGSRADSHIELIQCCDQKTRLNAFCAARTVKKNYDDKILGTIPLWG